MALKLTQREACAAALGMLMANDSRHSVSIAADFLRRHDVKVNINKPFSDLQCYDCTMIVDSIPFAIECSAETQRKSLKLALECLFDEENI